MKERSELWALFQMVQLKEGMGDLHGTSVKFLGVYAFNPCSWNPF